MSRDLSLRFARSASTTRLRFDPGGLPRLGGFARTRSTASRVLLVSDRNVARYHGARASRALTRAGFAVHEHVVAPGERSKSIVELERLWTACSRAAIGRRDLLVALGGGVVGDLAGLGAATWLRGIDWINVPSSLLAQADSCVGGKTAVDVPAGKNLVGAFHQPVGVLIDATLLRTISPPHRRAGLAEVAKTGVAVDRALFAWLERHAEALSAGDTAALAETVERCVRAKARVVIADERERERGPRTALNFGHTAAHAFEAARGYRGLLHGDAVAVGMHVALALSVPFAGLAHGDRDRIGALFARLRLPRRVRAVRLPDVLAAMRRDKKIGAHGEVRWVLTPRIGAASVPRVVGTAHVRAALRAVGVCE